MSHQALILPALKEDWVIEERPTPKPNSHEILIRTKAISLTPADWKDQVIPGMIRKFPTVTGRDVAGVVISVGADVEHFAVNDRVVGFCIASATTNPDHGSFQEFVVLHDHLTARIPDSVTFEEGSTIPTAIATAAGLLRRVGIDIQAPSITSQEQAVLVWGGTTSVGVFTIQLAVKAGYTVFTTASQHQHEYVKQLGAAAVFDYHTEDVAQHIATEVKRRIVTLTRFIDAASADLAATAHAVEELGGGELLTTQPWEMLVKTPAPSTVRPVMSGARDAILDKGYAAWVFHDMTEALLRDGELRVPKVELVSGGLSGIELGLSRLKSGVSGIKLVVSLQ